MDTFQMNQDLVSEKTSKDKLSEERKEIVLPKYQKDYFRAYAGILYENKPWEFLNPVQKKQLLVSAEEKPVLRFSEKEASLSWAVDMMYCSPKIKTNYEAFKDETTRVYEGFGIAKEDISMFLSLAETARSAGVGTYSDIFRLLRSLEIFYKLSSRGGLSKTALIVSSKKILEETQKCIIELSQNKMGISTELANKMLDSTLPIRRSVKSVYSQIEPPDNRYKALKKEIVSLGKEEIQDSRLLLLRYQGVLEDIDTLLSEEENNKTLSTLDIDFLRTSRTMLLRVYSNMFEQEVITDDWATKATEMSQLRGGFLYLCESERGEDQEKLGNMRLKKLKDFVASMVNKWTPHDSETDDSWLESHTESIVGNIKKKIVENGKITNLIAYLFQMIPIQQARMMDSWQGSTLGKMSGNEFPDVMPAFFKGLDQTMGNVVYWACETKADSVESFELCGSDMHDSGLGVCKVEFKKQGISKRFVIKPDDRQFEQIIFGKQGFVKEFNKSVEDGQVSLIDVSGAPLIRRSDLRKEKEIDAVRTFEMQSSESKKHGVLIEHLDVGQVSAFYGGKEIDGKVNPKGRLFAQLICGIFGISDLNEQNVGYWKTYLNKIFYPALIDSECGMELLKLGSFAEASEQEGFSKVKIDEKWKLSIDERLFSRLIDCINVLFDRENPIKCRYLVIKTSIFDENRGNLMTYPASVVKKTAMAYLRGEGKFSGQQKVIVELLEEIKKHWDDRFNSVNQDRRLKELYGGEGPLLKCTDQEYKTALKCILDDYFEGKVPFYEINPVTGELTTRGGAVVGKIMPKLSDDARIEMMKKIMMSNIYVGKEKAWDYYQRTSGLSFVI